MKNRIVEGYADFLSSSFDKKVLSDILSLSRDPWFTKNKISIAEIIPESPKMYRHSHADLAFNIAKKAKSNVQSYMYSKYIKCFYIDDGEKASGNTRNFSVYQYKSKGNFKYRVKFFDYGIHFKDPTTAWKMISKTEDGNTVDKKLAKKFADFDESSIETNNIISYIKSRIIDRFETHKTNISSKADNAKKEQDKKDRFLKKFTPQFFEEQLSGLFDICDSHTIENIPPFGYSGQHPIRIFLRSQDLKMQRKGDHTFFCVPNSKVIDILEEMDAAKDRLSEHDLDFKFSFFHDGIFIEITYVGNEFK